MESEVDHFIFYLFSSLLFEPYDRVLFLNL